MSSPSRSRSRSRSPTGTGLLPGLSGGRCLSCNATLNSAHFRSVSAFHSSVRQHQRICQDILETDSDCSVHSSDGSGVEVSSGEEIPIWPARASHGGPAFCEEEEQGEGEDEMPQECDNCGREFDDEPQFKDHVLYCPKRYKCVLCPCPPLTWDVFQTHVLSHPSDDDERRSSGTTRPSSASSKRTRPAKARKTSMKRVRPYPNLTAECEEPRRGLPAVTASSTPMGTSNFNHDHAPHEGNGAHSHYSKPSDATSPPPISTPSQPFMAQCDGPPDTSATPQVSSLLSESINPRDEAPLSNPTPVIASSNRCEGSFSFHGHMT